MQTDQALQVYLKADTLKPNDVRIHCCISRGYAELMNNTNSVDEKRELGLKALDYAERALKLSDKSDIAHLCVAVCYGRIAPLESARKKIAYSKQVKEHVDAALALNPHNDLALYVLGEWNYELASLNPVLRMLVKMIYGEMPEASMDRAEECFRSALALNATEPSYYIELGRALAAKGDKVQALAEMKRGYGMPDVQRDDAFVKNRARELYESLQ